MIYNDIVGNTNDFFVGVPGSGKTLLAVYDYILPALIAGEQVYSSTWINWNLPNLHFVSADDFRSRIPEFVNCVLFLDEIQRILEPREWDSENGDIRALFQLHRHRHLSIVGTTQDPSLIAKSALIVVDNFIYTEKISHSLFSRLFYGSSSLPLQYHYLNRNQLRSVFNFFDMGQELPILDFSRRKFISPKSLYRYDLDDFKLEYYHYYCPLCASRQLKPISIETDPFQLPIPNCPKHPNQPLQIRESAMYDTDYELPPSDSSEVIWKPFRKVKVERLVESRSSLSPRGKMADPQARRA